MVRGQQREDLLQYQNQTMTIQTCRDVMERQAEELEKDDRQFGAPGRIGRRKAKETLWSVWQGTIPNYLLAYRTYTPIKI